MCQNNRSHVYILYILPKHITFIIEVLKMCRMPSSETYKFLNTWDPALYTFIYGLRGCIAMFLCMLRAPTVDQHNSLKRVSGMCRALPMCLCIITCPCAVPNTNKTWTHSWKHCSRDYLWSKTPLGTFNILIIAFIVRANKFLFRQSRPISY